MNVCLRFVGIQGACAITFKENPYQQEPSLNGFRAMVPGFLVATNGAFGEMIPHCFVSMCGCRELIWTDILTGSK